MRIDLEEVFNTSMVPVAGGGYGDSYLDGYRAVNRDTGEQGPRRQTKALASRDAVVMVKKGGE